MGVETKNLNFKVLAEVVGAQAIQSLQKDVKGLADSTNFVKHAVGGLIGAFGVHEIIEFNKGILETAETFKKLSEKTGSSVEDIAAISGAAELANVPIEGLTKSLGKFSLNIVEATHGNRELAGTYAGLGISLKEQNGDLKSSGTVIKELAGKFADLKDGPEKAAIAMKLFGKSGTEWIPVLNEGTEAFEGLGLQIDSDFAARASKFNESIKAIGINIKNNAIGNLKELLPTLETLGDAFADFTKGENDSTGFMEILGESARQLSVAFVISFTAVKGAIDTAITGFREGWAFIKGNGAEVSKLDAELAARLKKQQEAEDAFIVKAEKNSRIFGEGSVAEIRAREQEDTKGKKIRTGNPNTDSIGENAKIIHEFEQKIAKLKAEAQATDESNASKETAVLLAELESKGIAKSSKAYADLSDKIIVAVNEQNVAKEKLVASNFLQKQTEGIELQKLETENYGLSAVELQKLTEHKKLENEVSEATKKFTEEGAMAYREAAMAVQEQRDALIDLQQKQKETWTVGAKESFRDYLDNAKDVARQTRDVFNHAFSNMEDALVDFVKTGNLNFKKFADDLISDIIRIQVRAVLAQTVSGIGGLFAGFFSGGNSTTTAGGAGDAGGVTAGSDVSYAATGGVMTSKGMAKLRAYAGGGVANSPQLAVFGEGTRPEAFVPLPDGRSIPVSMKGGGGGDTNVNVSVNVESGTESTKADSDKGAQLGKLIAAAVRGEIVNQKRPGGLLA